MIIETLFIIAFVLLATEAFMPTKGILALAGFIAYIAGVWILISSGQDSLYGVSVTNIIILGIIFFIAFVLFFYALSKNLQKNVETGMESLNVQEATVKQWKNGKGKVFIDGEDWRAKGPENLKSDDVVIVTDHDKLTLTVEKK